ncbi:MAG: hypothetical protein EA402_12770 [Planctomycetota bacterium]|nr:MAG: hypothetical protein EA402_12770 [Planctomycetota bacterium]
MVRCILFILLLMGVLSVSVSPPLAGEELSDEQIIARLQEQRPEDRAIRRGLEWLREQQLESGAVGDRSPTALTSLAIMAHLAAGHAIHDPEHGEWLQRSLGYVLSQQEDNGYFGEADGSRMYGHGIALLMLAEALGMSDDPLLDESMRDALTRAVAVSVNAAKIEKDERHQGGWRYHPHSDDSDLSLSGWHLMGLHAAQQVGITVPEEVIQGAVDYARRLTSEDGEVAYNRPGGGDRPGIRGLGMLSFAIGKAEDDPLVDAIASRIRADPIEWRGRWLYYRIYYDAVGMARSRPEIWQSYRSRLITMLVDEQDEAGFWPQAPSNNEGSHGKVYFTSMCILALAVDRYVLPSYQR